MTDKPPAPIARRTVLGAIELSSHQQALLAVIAFAGLIALWWAVVQFNLIDRVLLPPPQDVLAAFIAGVKDGSLAVNVWASLVRVIEGFVIALLIAVPLGVAMGSSQIVRGLVDPVVELIRPIPPIAVIPLSILWFGIDELSKVFIIAYGAFFPILVNTMAGFREVDVIHIRAARTLGAGRYEIFRDVILRSALPFIIVGARLGMSMAFIVLVAAELIASSEGLGYLINDARYNFRTDRIFLGMACIGVLGFLLNRLLLETERRLLRWRLST